MNKFFVSAMFLLGLCCASCSSDEGFSYSQNPVTNSELKTILVQKGYQFSEDGKLLMDDLAQNTKTLDFSGSKISTDALAELSIFPNLTDVDLSDNGYGPTFDFAKLPEQITGVDLRGNELYDFEGLVDVKMENDERQTTVLHNLKKLYLPESAKYNVEDLMPYYETAGETTDMQMINKDNTLEKYNTLREIPDEYFRAYLKTVYPSLFVTDNQIDISKPQSINEQGQNLMLGLMTQYDDLDKIASVEGVEYFINNPFYKPSIIALNCADFKNPVIVHYVTPRSNIKALLLYNVNTPSGIDFSKATSLSALQLSNDDGIKSIDLTNTAFANQEIEDFDVLAGNNIGLISCKNLEEVKFNTSAKGYTADIQFVDLPSLKQLDLSFIVGITSFTLQSLPNCTIVYPLDKLKYRYHDSRGLIELPSRRYKIGFDITEDVNKLEATQTFINKFKESLKVSVE